MVVMTIGWCVSGTATAFAISRVVYGLRAEVKSAMRLGLYTREGKIGEGGMLSTEKQSPPDRAPLRARGADHEQAHAPRPRSTRSY